MFKLVRVEPDGLKSCSEKDRVVVYRVNEWTERPSDCGPLAVFDTLENLMRFVTIRGWLRIVLNPLPDGIHLVIYTCEIEESKDEYLWTPGRLPMVVNCLPMGTVLADRVKLLEEFHL